MKKNSFIPCVACCGITMITPLIAAALPGEIQTCVDVGDCTNPLLLQQTQAFAAYTYVDNGVNRYLFEYRLDGSSGESTNFGTTAFSGSAWLSANAIYDLTQERHFFDWYLDAVTPSPTNLWVLDSDGLDTHLSMSTSNLLDGNGFFRLGENQDGDFFVDGEMGTLGDLGQGGYPLGENHSFLPCLAATCEVGGEINLLFMEFVQSGTVATLVLNSADERNLLYRQYRDWAEDDSWYTSQSYRVIPLPAGVWLLISGVAGLIGVSRHNGPGCR